MKRFNSALLHGLLLAVLVLVPVSLFSTPVERQGSDAPKVEQVRWVRGGVYYGGGYYYRPYYRYYGYYRPYYYNYYPYYGYGYGYGW